MLADVKVSFTVVVRRGSSNEPDASRYNNHETFVNVQQLIQSSQQTMVTADLWATRFHGRIKDAPSYVECR